MASRKGLGKEPIKQANVQETDQQDDQYEFRCCGHGGYRGGGRGYSRRGWLYDRKFKDQRLVKVVNLTF